MSEADIVNLALAHLGDSANVSTIAPPDGSMQAEYAARFYPLARDTLLERHDWGFATATVALAATSSTVGGWAYAYAMPADCIKFIGLMPDGMGFDSLYFDTVRDEIAAFGRPAWLDQLNRSFLTMGGHVMANQPAAVGVYTLRVTDTTRFPALFVRALSWLLAADLAGPIIKGSTGKSAALECTKMFELTLAGATVSDANAQSTSRTSRPPWISDR